MSRTRFSLAGRLLGEGQPCFVVAHVGHAHEGSAERALRLIEAAFQAGADAVAFSIFRTEEVVVRRHPERRELEQLELSDGDWRRVLEAARASGLAVIAEVHDLASRELALAASVDALQSHPSDADHPELLHALAASELPFLLASGEAREPFLAETLDAAAGAAALVIGPATAPAAAEELRLGEILHLRERLRVPVGLLDPTDGGSAFALVTPALAACAGASFVEKRLVLDRSRRGRDASAAVSPEEFYRMVDLLRQSERARGEGVPLDSGARGGGRSIVAAGLIGRGEVLSRERLLFKRTGDRLARGLPPSAAERVIGRRAARPIQADEPIREDMLE